MQENQHFLLKLFSLILLCTLFFTAFSRIGTFAYEKVFMQDTPFSDVTFIGPVEVHGIQKDDVSHRLNQPIANWQSANGVQLSFADQKVDIPGKLFRFHVEESIAAAVPGNANPLYTTIHEQDLIEELRKILDETILSNVNIKSLRARLEEEAGALNTKVSVIKISDHMGEGVVKRQSILSNAEIKIDGTSLSSWLESHSQVIIPAQDSFSFLELLNDEDPFLSNELLTKISSGIYEAILPTNIQIMERYIGKELPEGITAGFEARVVKEKMDLMLFNPNDSDITIQFDKVNNRTVEVSVLGIDLGNSYKVRFENKKTYEPKKIIQYQDNIKNVFSSERKGRKGSSVSVYRDEYNSQGERLKTTLIAEDFYLPVNEIIIRKIAYPETSETETTESQRSESEKIDGEVQGVVESEADQKDTIAEDSTELANGER
ncbi:hypothetical protein GCM10009865_35410 [Aeromicrobium ponti]|uniref:VanW like protein n=2 Tax=Cytobacillus oceanisediminis TaxID=665099 RepID=A0A562JNS0_9BACI|nr:VanW like protein [Cytobacillus oceanisediminis]